MSKTIIIAIIITTAVKYTKHYSCGVGWEGGSFLGTETVLYDIRLIFFLYLIDYNIIIMSVCR